MASIVRPAPSLQHDPGRRFSTYLLWVLLAPICGYLLIFPLVRLPQLGFDRWGSKWGPVLSYPYETSHVDADLVIFGDSSAFLGTDPRLIDRELGTHSVVLPNTIGSLQATGDMALRRYLAHNRPPKLLVFYFMPWDLDLPHEPPSPFIFEGEEVLLQHADLRTIADFAVHHPTALPEFPFQVSSALRPSTVAHDLHTDRSGEVKEGQGHIGYTEPFGPIHNNCEIPDQFLRRQDTAYIRQLMQRYSSPQTRVLLYLAPIPSCSNAPTVLREPLPGIQAPASKILPHEWFAADPFFAHILPAHVAADTQVFIRALRGYGIGGSETAQETGSQVGQ